MIRLKSLFEATGEGFPADSLEFAYSDGRANQIVHYRHNGRVSTLTRTNAYDDRWVYLPEGEDPNVSR